FCSAIQESVSIKEAQVACFDDPGDPYFENPRCSGWYAFNNAGGTNIEPNHWGQAGLNRIGRALGTTAAAHATGDPVAWEIGVEVPQPAEWCEAPEDVPCDDAVRSIRLDVYADDGTTRLHYTAVAPSIAGPDWTADFDPGPDAGADW